MLCLTYKIKSCSIDNNDSILYTYYSVNVDKMSPKILPKMIKKFSRNYPRHCIIYAKLDSIINLKTNISLYGISVR